MRGRAAVALGAFMAVAVVATACGGSKPVAKPAVVIAGAPDKTTKGTARFSGRTWLDIEGHRAVVQTMSGIEDFDAHRSTLVSRSPLSRYEPTRDDRVMRAIKISPVTYESLSGLDLPGGRRWVRMEPTDLGMSPEQSQSLGSQNPADGLQFLSGARNAHLVGAATVHGVATIRYTTSIDMRAFTKALAKGSTKLSPTLQQGLDALGKRVDLAKLPGSVWVDDAGRVRRFQYSLSVPAPSGPKLRITTSLEYSDFGTTASIEAPPAAETVAYSEVQDQMREYFADLQASGAQPAT